MMNQGVRPEEETRNGERREDRKEKTEGKSAEARERTVRQEYLNEAETDVK